MGGELLGALVEAKELCDVASDICGMDMAWLISDASDEELRPTERAQPAIFLVSYLLHRLVQDRGLVVTAAAGHSLGEYTALAASGRLEFAPAMALVWARSQAMADAALAEPGTMSAVLGLAADEVTRATTQVSGAWVANYNSESQTVISGRRDSLDRAGSVLQRSGAKRVVPLAVGGAFHTPLMESARPALERALQAVEWSPGRFPVYANVDARPHPVDGGQVAQRLSAQLTSPVLWRQTVDQLLADGHDALIELGPRRVLLGLLKSGEGAILSAQFADSADGVARLGP